MPLTDLLNGLSSAPPPARKERPAGEHLAGLLAWLVCPLIDFLVVSSLDPGTSYVIPMFALPGGLAVGTYLLGRPFGGRPAFCAGMAVLCAMTCYMATVAGAFSSMF